MIRDEIAAHSFGKSAPSIKSSKTERRLRSIRNASLELAISICAWASELTESLAQNQFPQDSPERWQELASSGQKLKRSGGKILEDRSLEIQDLRLVLRLVILNTMIRDLARQWQRLETEFVRKNITQSCPRLLEIAVETQNVVESIFQTLFTTEGPLFVSRADADIP